MSDVYSPLFIPPERTLTVGKSNAMYQSIQDAIDDISDAATTNRYTVQIYPGVYQENITGKDYVSLIGVGDLEDVVIYGTSGTLYTGPSTFSAVTNMAFLLTPTASGSKVFDYSAGGTQIIDRTFVTVSSSTNGITSQILTATNCDLDFIRTDITYSMFGTSAGANTHTLIKGDGTSGMLLSYLNYVVTVNDVDDDVVIIEDGGTGNSVITQSGIIASQTNASYSGTMTGIRFKAAGALKTAVFTSINLFGSGSGTGQSLEVDSGGGAVTASSTHNQCSTLGFSTNRQFKVDTGDTLNSSNDYQNAVDGSTGAGTVNFVTTNVYGSVNITGGGSFTIDDQNEWHAVNTLAVGEASLNMETSAGMTGSITAFADAGGGQVTVTSAGHGLITGEIITITGTTNYNGVFTIANTTTDTFEITDTWVADDGTGTWRHGSHLVPNQKGAYKLSWAFSAASAGANVTFDFAAFRNGSEISGTKITRKFGTAGDVGSVAGEAIINLNPDDFMWFAIKNTTNATNITISDGALVLNKVS